MRAVTRFALRPTYRQDLTAEWRRRLRGEPALPSAPLRRVLVVCHGNICRSPFAESLLARRAPSLETRSGGLAAAEGEPANESAVRVARDWNLDLREHRTHRLADADLGWADLVLAMTGSQHVQLTQRWRQFAGNVRLLGDYLSEPPHVIADPYGESDEIFRHAFGQIDRAVQRLLKLMPSA